MQFLPIKSVREEDTPLIGKNLANLARLQHLNFPVAQGLIIFPPELPLKSVIEHFQLEDREIFEQRLAIIRAEILAIPCPDELGKELISRSINKVSVWENLLDSWITEIRSKIWREGFSEDLTANLSAQPLFFTPIITSSGSAYFDTERHILVIENLTGEITEYIEDSIKKLVISANKKLFIPQKYEWIIEGSDTSHRLKLIKVSPYTPDYTKVAAMTEFWNDSTSVHKVVSEKKSQKPVMKVFFDCSNTLQVINSVDGYFLSSQKMEFLHFPEEIEKLNLSTADKKIWQLTELSADFPTLPLIFKLFDNPTSAVRGSLHLTHKSDLLKQEVEIIQFVRNKRNLLNLQVSIPFVRSSEEFLQIKRDLAAFGLHRKGSLKFWLELAVPENLLNIDKYLEGGLDGVIFNLDELISWLGGFSVNGEESIFYKQQVSALLLMLEPVIKKLHKAHLPIIVTGSLSTHDDILAFLIEHGIYGVVVDSGLAGQINDHLVYLEKRMLKKRIDL